MEDPLRRIFAMAPKLVALPLEQCLREVKMCAAFRRGDRGLEAEVLQAKLLLLVNRQMFVQGVDAENRPALLQQLLSSLNRQRFVLGFDAENRPAIFPLVPLNFFSCG
jgi:hypothetical protein